MVVKNENYLDLVVVKISSLYVTIPNIIMLSRLINSEQYQKEVRRWETKDG